MKSHTTGCRFLSVTWLSAIAFALPCFAKQAAEVPGVVADKPAAGRCVEWQGKYLVPYSETIPGTLVRFEMIPVPGGELLMGSPAGEQDRGEDEGPQVRVKLPPYWIGKCEVTWAEYHAYMEMYEGFKKLQSAAAYLTDEDKSAAEADYNLVRNHARDATELTDARGIDGVTSPTPLYMPDFTYGVGDKPEQPAVTMTQYAARQYTKWLSGLTGRSYRLPSEAEWEYAARAGTTTAYSFGDDAAKLGDFAWFDDNADGATHPVGTKQANPWGLHDMHGNVAEWTLDQYDAARYGQLGGAAAVAGEQAIAWPTKLFPRAIRGGCWFDAAPLCRSAARLPSQEDEWKLSDPNFPHSPWWYTEDPATGVGMRIVRPLTPLAGDEPARAWEADVDSVREDVKMRLNEGRGALGVADPDLPAAMEAAERLEK